MNLTTLSGIPWKSALDKRQRIEASLHPNISYPTACVLASRGIDPPLWRSHLRLDDAYSEADATALDHMDRASQRIADAILAHETVGLIGDFDVDGVTSTAILAAYLKAAGVRCQARIPSRARDGHGPNHSIINDLADAGASLIIMLDCGSNAIDEIQHAALECGADVIILDHHVVTTAGHTTFALVNPNKQSDSSGYGAMSASCVAYLTICAVHDALPITETPEVHPSEFLDLAAIGAVADVAQLTSQNRRIVRAGLAAISHNRRPGLMSLLRVANLDLSLQAEDIAFKLAPRLNAAGRLADATMSLELLTTQDPANADYLAERLDQLNTERKVLETQAVTLAVADADARIQTRGREPILISIGPWPAGVLGLVAGRLREQYQVPTLALTFTSNAAILAGSARSTPGVNIGALITEAVELGLARSGGGHPMAAGLSLTADNLEPLRDFLCRRAAETALPPPPPELPIEISCDCSHLTRAAGEELALAGPFGAGNPNPIAALIRCQIQDLAELGKGHTRFTAFSPRTNAKTRCVLFNVAPDHPFLAAAAQSPEVHIAGNISITRWTPSDRCELKVVDLALST